MFIRNLAAFTDGLGVQNAPMIIALAQVPWPDDQTRNDFIYNLTGVNIVEKGSNG